MEYNSQEEDILNKTKPFDISKDLVMQAYEQVKANKGAAGIDQQSLEDFDKNLKDNLYKLWNRMSSGSYFPPPVMAVPIPKKSGGVRILGIPTVADRIAQMVVKLMFEPNVEPHFLPDSYGYRPNKSALDAVGVTRQRCWKYDWVVEFDIKGLFDNIDHELLMKAVKRHTDDKCILLHIERWLKAPMQCANGEVVARNRGTPQGGVVSPMLSNIFMHYAYDAWMSKYQPTVPWCRYADDGLAHCKTENEALQILAELTQRFKKCGLEMHPDKTKIVYCKDDKRKGEYPKVEFEFLGYCFRQRVVKNSKSKKLFSGFLPAASKTAIKSMRTKTRTLGIRLMTELSLLDIAKICNPILRGWINYYGKYGWHGLRSVLRHFNKTLVTWAMRKFKKLKRRRGKATHFIINIQRKQPELFAHWKFGIGRTVT